MSAIKCWTHLHQLGELSTYTFFFFYYKTTIPPCSSPLSPAPLLLSLLGSESSVLGQWCEVVPAVDREGLKRSIRTLCKDVVGCIFCNTALLLAFEPATNMYVDRGRE